MHDKCTLLLLTKSTDIASVLLNSDKNLHILGLSESKLSSHISDSDISMPGYKIVRMDPKQHKETGLVVYIHDSLTFKRLHHSEQHAVESVWIELKLKRVSPLLLGFVYRNPEEHVDWTGNFISMTDTVCLESK